MAGEELIGVVRDLNLYDDKWGIAVSNRRLFFTQTKYSAALKGTIAGAIAELAKAGFAARSARRREDVLQSGDLDAFGSSKGVHAIPVEEVSRVVLTQSRFVKLPQVKFEFTRRNSLTKNDITFTCMSEDGINGALFLSALLEDRLQFDMKNIEMAAQFAEVVRTLSGQLRRSGIVVGPLQGPASPKPELSTSELLSFARERLAARDFPSATSALLQLIGEQAAQSAPERAETFRLLGTIRGAEGRRDEAKSYLARAIEANESDAIAHGNLATLLVQEGQLDAAVQHLTRALELSPSDSDYRTGLSIVFRKMGRFDEAERTLLNAPDPSSVRSELLKLYLEPSAHTWGKAEDLLQKEVVSQPNSAEAYAYLGYAQHHLGKLGEAEQNFRRAVQIDPRNQLAQTFLVMKSQGKW